MTLKINNRTFSGAAAVFDGTLSAALAAVAVNEAKRCLDAADPTALTDNSGGAAADGAIGAIAIPTVGFTEVGTASAQKAEFDAALVNCRDAFTEIGTKLEEIFTKVPALTFTESAGGSAADNTIAVIDVSMTAVATSIVSSPNFLALAPAYAATIASLAAAANAAAVAVGVAPLVDSSGGDVQWGAAADSITIPALGVSTGTAVDGTALSGVSKVQADAFLASVAAAVKEIATKVNAVITAAALPTVTPIVKVADV